MNIDVYLAALRAEVDAALTRVLTQPHAPAVIAEAMRYPIAGGGKRLRPCLTLAIAEACGARLDLDVARARALALPGACAVEMIHTYSLVHDDLPAMDNDDLRRGRATTHVVYGDGAAILVGDGLLTEAFSVLAASPSPATPPDAPAANAEQRLRAVATLAHAAGAAGMVGGQAVDLVNEGQVKGATARLDGAGLEDMH
ncbi:MAG TPA: polyprenyl synthetase family protein, partial [Vicinamibacterales bacterium]|nr:polyprenyl synthetase family protein [Vicinamibacterales bacterium]